MKYALRLMSFALFAVLMMPHAAGAKEEAKNSAGPANAMAAIKANKDLSKFADLIDEAGLEKMFEDKNSNLTVFAPTNEAFGKAPSDLMKKAKADKEHVQGLVKQHVITGSQVFMNNLRGRKVGPAAANGEGMLLDGTGKVVKVNEAEFVTPDIVAGNNIVHVVNAVLIPGSLRETPKPKEPEMRAMPDGMPERPGMKQPDAKAKTEQKTAPATESTPAPAAPAAADTPAQAPAAPAPVKKEEKKGGWLKKLGW